MAVYVVAMAWTLLGRSSKEAVRLPSAWPAEIKTASQAWFGPVSVLALVVLMYAASAYAFEIIQSLPIAAIGGGH
jgi:cytochrome c oxidase subunit 1